jgi:uncharacterized membrane protein YgdD (TMEM256/DUF423 family)
MSRPWLATGGLLGALGVLLGAFGAHLLRPWLPLQVMTVYETAVRYLLVHVLALLMTDLLLERHPARRRILTWAAWGFVSGCALFSGSLIGMSLTGWSWPGVLTPFGGVAWVAAWLCLALGFARREPA